MFEAVPGYPGLVDQARVAAFEGLVDALSAYQRDVMAIKTAPSGERRRQLTRAVLAEYGPRPALRQTVVVELIGLVRDHVGAEETLRYIRSLPEYLRRHTPVIEQEQIALARMEDLPGAAAALENLIKRVGPSADRCGILGGRYKRLMREATTPGEREHYLERAIAASQRGMDEDLNDYYPSSNLPRLYRLRNATGDEQRAVEVATVVMAACRRALARNPDDEWVLLTLLGAAFDRGDAEEAQPLVTKVRLRNPAGFHLGSTVSDLRMSYRLLPADARNQLGDVMGQMEEMWCATRT